MYFNRVEAKMAAKDSIRRTRPSCALVMILYVLLTTGVSYLISRGIGGVADDFMTYLYRGYPLEQILRHLILQNPGRVLLYGLVQFLFSLYSALMSFGLVSYTLRVARNENPDPRHLLDGFLKIGRVLWKGVLVDIYAYLWGLAGFLPLMLLALFFSDSELVAMAVVFGGIIWVFVVIYVVLRYELANFFLLDDPACTARESIRRSVAAMKGHIWEFIALNFSFFGWALLIGLAAGGLGIFWEPLTGLGTMVGALWLTPYVAVTQANFYDFITGTLNRMGSSGDYAGPNYDYHATDGPQPF